MPRATDQTTCALAMGMDIADPRVTIGSYVTDDGSIQPAQPSLPVMVVHGLEATGKSTVVMSLLDAVGVPHAVIKSQECITARHLLERTVSSCEDALAAKAAADGEQMSRQGLGRCESLSVLAVHLQKLLEGRSNFVLVFDGIDRQREAPPTLLQGLARLGDFVSLIDSPPRQY